MIKKYLSIFIVFMLLINLYPAEAEENIIALSINDEILDISPSTMPRFIDVAVYVPYTLIPQYFDINAAYNSDMGILVLYENANLLTFNLKEHTVFDDGGQSYSPTAQKIGNTVYVPLNVVSEVFDLYYSYLTSVVPLVRMSETKPSLSDSVFLSIATPIVETKIYEYNNQGQDTYIPPSPVTPPTDEVTDNDEPEEDFANTVKITFDAPFSSFTSEILDYLESYNINATFFVDVTTVEQNEELIRRIIGSGHSIGALVTDAENIIQNIDDINTALYDTISYKTRLVRISDGSEDKLTQEVLEQLIQGGYRLWDYSVNANEGVSSVSTVNNNIERVLSRKNADVAIKLSHLPHTLSVLDNAVDFCREYQIDMDKIYLSTEPINFYNELR